MGLEIKLYSYPADFSGILVMAYSTLLMTPFSHSAAGTETHSDIAKDTAIVNKWPIIVCDRCVLLSLVSYMFFPTFHFFV